MFFENQWMWNYVKLAILLGALLNGVLVTFRDPFKINGCFTVTSHNIKLAVLKIAPHLFQVEKKAIC